MTRARDLADGKHLTNVDSNTLAVDASNNRVGVGTASPSQTLHVQRASSGGSAVAGAALIVEGTDATGSDIQILGDASDYQQLLFGDADDNDVGSIAYSHSSNTMRFQTNGSERLRILSGGGLTFNGDTAATNALDDYEEGTFTPTLNGTSSDPTITYNSGGQQGHYTKVGNLVSFQIRVHTSAYSGGSGNLYISGLPFTASSSLDSYSGAVGLNYQWGSNLNPMAWTIDAGGSVVYLWQNNNNADVVVTGNGAASLRVRLQGFYYT